jgi:hypothetical protein
VPAAGLEAGVTRLAVFGYASLVSPASAAATLGRPVEFAALARLEGWSRGWTVGRDNAAAEKTFALTDGSLPRYCLGLNLDPDPAAHAPNGVLIEVSEAELDRLDLRELRYHRTEVTGSITVAGEVGFDAVYAYRARPEHRHPEPPDGAVIISTYPALVERAFAELGPDQLELYRATTAPPPVEIVDATLVADAIPQGNPRAW